MTGTLEDMRYAIVLCSDAEREVSSLPSISLNYRATNMFLVMPRTSAMFNFMNLFSLAEPEREDVSYTRKIQHSSGTKTNM